MAKGKRQGVYRRTVSAVYPPTSQIRGFATAAVTCLLACGHEQTGYVTVHEGNRTILVGAPPRGLLCRACAQGAA
jgi:hypothetical protein